VQEAQAHVSRIRAEHRVPETACSVPPNIRLRQEPEEDEDENDEKHGDPDDEIDDEVDDGYSE